VSGGLSSAETACEEVTQRVGGSRAKILIVDDDPVSTELMVRLAQRAGYSALGAATAEEALALFVPFQPDVVVLDVVLPGVDGVAAMHQMRRLAPDRWLPVVLVSARNTSEEVLKGLTAGANDYLTKPVVVEHLLAKLKNICLSLTLSSELRASFRFTKAIMDNMKEGLLCADERGLVIASNSAAEKLFGFEPGGLIGVPFSRLVTVNGEADEFGLESSSKQVCLAAHRDGRRIPISAERTTLEIDGRAVAVTTVHDVTKQLEEERRMLNDAARLRDYHEAREAENELASKLLDKLLRRDRSVVRSVRSFTQPATGFSGDVVAAVRSPGGKLFVMLADATGHGLAAAISLIPALSALYAMVARERSLEDIVAELNTKLLATMPVGHFLAAGLVCLDQAHNSGEIWVGGLPSVLLLDRLGQVVRSFDSDHLPLGITPSTPEYSEPARFAWNRPLQLLLVSDGILEGESALGEPFGTERLIRAVAHTGGRDRLTSVTLAFKNHLAGLRNGDDASIALVDLD
jgi:PAS domain S-box-containing protein